MSVWVWPSWDVMWRCVSVWVWPSWDVMWRRCVSVWVWPGMYCGGGVSLYGCGLGCIVEEVCLCGCGLAGMYCGGGVSVGVA